MLDTWLDSIIDQVETLNKSAEVMFQNKRKQNVLQLPYYVHPH